MFPGTRGMRACWLLEKGSLKDSHVILGKDHLLETR